MAGARVAEVLTTLHETAKHVGGQTIKFNKSILKSLESTVDGIAPEMQNWPPLPASSKPSSLHQKRRRKK